jgi:hypothetical protein
MDHYYFEDVMLSQQQWNLLAKKIFKIRFEGSYALKKDRTSKWKVVI